MFRRLLRPFLFFCAIVAVLFFGTTCTTVQEVPAGIAKKTCRVDCGGDSLAVDFYYPKKQTGPLPAVVVVHGFSRSKRYMAGWGTDLAGRGMIVAVPTLPSYAGHSRNAEAVARLAELGRAGKWPVDARTNGRIGLVGFSMGGLVTLLAAAKLSPPVDAWAGLDPVEIGGRGAAKAPLVRVPGLALLAEPSAANWHGNGTTMLKEYAGPLRILRVKGATHCDAESPTDILGQLVCGRVSSGRHARILEVTAAFLEENLNGPASHPLRTGIPAGMEPVPCR